ncbi:MAG: hypothetical protein OHK0046_51120 [Anaerolineae bacterium]
MADASLNGIHRVIVGGWWGKYSVYIHNNPARRFRNNTRMPPQPGGRDTAGCAPTDYAFRMEVRLSDAIFASL